MSPSFGFVIGFIPMAAITGLIVKKFGAKLSALFAAAAAGTLVLYIFGLAYGFFIMNVYLSRGMSIGVLIWTFVGKFIPADILKCVAAALLSAKLIPAVKKIL